MFCFEADQLLCSWSIDHADERSCCSLLNVVLLGHFDKCVL